MSEQTQRVTLVGPMRMMVEMTDEELERARSGEHPATVFERRPLEWEPVGSANEWSVTTRGSPDHGGADG